MYWFNKKGWVKKMEYLHVKNLNQRYQNVYLIVTLSYNIKNI